MEPQPIECHWCGSPETRFGWGSVIVGEGGAEVLYATRYACKDHVGTLMDWVDELDP